MLRTLANMFVAPQAPIQRQSWILIVLSLAAGICIVFGGLTFIAFLISLPFAAVFSAASVPVFLSFSLMTFLLPAGFLLWCASFPNASRLNLVFLAATGIAAFVLWHSNVGADGAELLSRLLDDSHRKAFDFSCLAPAAWQDYWPTR